MPGGSEGPASGSRKRQVAPPSVETAGMSFGPAFGKSSSTGAANVVTGWSVRRVWAVTSTGVEPLAKVEFGGGVAPGSGVIVITMPSAGIAAVGQDIVVVVSADVSVPALPAGYAVSATAGGVVAPEATQIVKCVSMLVGGAMPSLIVAASV